MCAQYLRDMARTPISDRPLVAQWLIGSRKRFTNPATGHTWSAEFFLSELQAASGWAPNISNYAQWESGEVTPKDENLRPVIAFYAARGIEGPDFTPAPVVPDLATAILALTHELGEARREREEYRKRLADLEMTVAGLAGRNHPDGGRGAPPTPGTPEDSAE